MQRYINELNGELYYSKWTVEGGLNGETCSDSETREGGVLWCDNVIINEIIAVWDIWLDAVGMAVYYYIFVGSKTAFIFFFHQKHY